MPDKDNSHIILAAHSGSSSVSFFNQLDELSRRDIINLYYQSNKYTYMVSDIYEVMKTGEVNITRSKEARAITLITCQRDNNEKQLVITAYMQ